MNIRHRHALGTQDMCAYIVIVPIMCICVTGTFARGPKVTCACKEGIPTFCSFMTKMSCLVIEIFFAMQFRLIFRLARDCVQIPYDHSLSKTNSMWHRLSIVDKLKMVDEWLGNIYRTTPTFNYLSNASIHDGTLSHVVYRKCHRMLYCLHKKNRDNFWIDGE